MYICTIIQKWGQHYKHRARDMNRYDEFEARLEALMNEFADLDYEDMASALEFQSERAMNMSNRR